MSGLVLFNLTISGNADNDDLAYAGHARCTGMGRDDPDIIWTAVAPVTAAPTDINDICQKAAIVAALERGFKTLVQTDIIASAGLVSAPPPAKIG